MKVIIAGGRDFKNYLALSVKCDDILSNTKDVTIVSGGAEGADRLGERYAILRDLPLIEFPADWKTHGKAAGPIRNKQMAQYADALIAFWDGKSKGTKNMIDLAKANNLNVRVINY